jgi:hypothetical protein
MRTRLQTTALLLLLCGRVAFASGVAKRPLVEFHGNVLFDELLFRSVLDLPESAIATPAEARAVSAKLLGFLRRAGYHLAVVRAKVQGEQIMVAIDEGELDKIIVFGQACICSWPTSSRSSLSRDGLEIGRQHGPRYHAQFEAGAPVA